VTAGQGSRMVSGRPGNGCAWELPGRPACSWSRRTRPRQGMALYCGRLQKLGPCLGSTRTPAKGPDRPACAWFKLPRGHVRELAKKKPGSGCRRAEVKDWKRGDYATRRAGSASRVGALAPSPRWLAFPDALRSPRAVRIEVLQQLLAVILKGRLRNESQKAISACRGVISTKAYQSSLRWSIA
jgi:hypothetical protein